jgi:predicted secreted hydrolase
LRITIPSPRRKLWRSGVASVVFIVAIAAWSDDRGLERSELSALLNAESNVGFAMAMEPRTFVFPRDHGPHPEFRNEWWYMTGNLDATDGRRFGFELTFFRFALAPELPESESAWRTNQVYVAHLALTDADGQQFFVAERFSRGALGLAGARSSPLRVWIDDWEIAATDVDAETENWRLQASDDDFALSLQLVAGKAPVLNGVNGLSQKSAEAGNASYYYSITRWQTDGQVRLGNDEFTVSGLSWLDREWSSSALASDQQGWDWFALQLSDGSELMFYRLRKTDGSQDVFSGGTWVTSDGTSRHISGDRISISATKTWSSPEGGTYPSSWEIRFPESGLALEVVPVMDDQELFTTVRYWEGAVDVTGTRDDIEITGRGYVELTGYAD